MEVSEFEESDSSSPSESIPFNSLFQDISIKSHLSHPQRAVNENFFSPIVAFFAVLKITNISWETSRLDVAKLLGISIDRVHIPIDTETGKTQGDIYVMMLDWKQLLQTIKHHSRKILNGRSLIMLPSSEFELYKSHFGEDLMFDIGQVNSIINICTNYKTYFSRKCAERPFEYVISALRLVEWYRLDKKQVKALFDLVTGTLSALKSHMLMQNHKLQSPLNAELLQELIESALDLSIFTNEEILAFPNPK